MKDEKLWYPSTHQTWVREYSSKVKHISPKELELSGYQSPYLEMYNLIIGAGWKKEASWWMSPRGNAKYQTVKQAYQSQKLWERQQGYEDSR